MKMAKAMKKAIIIGGGVGGPAVAMALQKAGIESEIYEGREQIVFDHGSFLTLARNGLRILETLGAAEAARERGFAVGPMSLYSNTGKKLTQMGPYSGGLFCERGPLADALCTETQRRGISITMGKKLVEAKIDRDDIIAHFADGTTACGDLLIGADGIHSRVRSLIDPQAPQARPVGLVGMGGYVHAPALAARCEAARFSFCFGKRMFSGWVPDPEGNVHWFLNIPHRESLARPERHALAAVSREAWRERVLELSKGDHTPLHALIEATPLESGFTAGLNDALPEVEHWWNERMVLLGDAIHAASPTSGQGASLALEDSLVLAKALRDHDHLSEALTSYEAARRPRVIRVATYAKQGNRAKVAGPLTRGLQDLFISIILKRINRPENEAWLYDFEIPWEEKEGIRQ